MIQTMEMFTIKCDNCGKLFEDEHMGYCAWGAESDAWEIASESGWITEDFDTHYCPNCYSYDDNDNLVLKEVKKVNE